MPESPSPARWVIVANIDSGGAHHDVVAEAAEILRADRPTALHWTADRAEVADVVDATGTDDALVVAGGDGSLHLMVNVLADRDRLDRPVAVLPLGTGNDLVRGLGLPLGAASTARGLAQPEARRLFTLRVGDRLVVNDVHLGAGARAAARADRWNKRFGALTYPLAAAVELARSQATSVQVDRSGGLVFDGDVDAVFVAAGATVGGGAEVAPGEAPTRPEFSVVAVEHTAGPRRIVEAWRYLRGGIDGVGGARRWSATTVTLHRVDDEPFDADLDGEVHTIGGPLPVTVGPPWTLLTPQTPPTDGGDGATEEANRRS